MSFSISLNLALACSDRKTKAQSQHFIAFWQVNRICRLEESRMQREHLLRHDDLKAELLLLMMAAPDTTSSLVCSVIDNIIQHYSEHKAQQPDAKKKLKLRKNKILNLIEGWMEVHFFFQF